MKTYQDKETGLWKVGSNGKAIHETEKAAKKAALDAVVDKLWALQTKRKNILQS